MSVKALSLCDGMSCGRISLDRAGIEVDTYYASEINVHAIKVTQANWPTTIQLGDVTKWQEWDIEWASIDLLIAGTPCQGFSLAGKQLAFDDPRSALFFVYVDILDHIRSFNPDVKFLLENVRMKQWCLNVISKYLDVKPVRINSALVSAQNRQRYYWANWEFEQPEDRGVMLIDILDFDEPSDAIGARVVARSSTFGCKQEWGSPFQRVNKKGKAKSNNNKAGCLTGGAHSGGNHSDMDIIVTDSDAARRYSTVECERLQTVPDNYTNHVSNTQRYKMLGDGWTVDVIAHIFMASAMAKQWGKI